MSCLRKAILIKELNKNPYLTRARVKAINEIKPTKFLKKLFYLLG